MMNISHIMSNGFICRDGRFFDSVSLNSDVSERLSFNIACAHVSVNSVEYRNHEKEEKEGNNNVFHHNAPQCL